MLIESQVAGIPCQIRVLSFFVQEPMGPSAPSDLDCYGYTEIEFEVLDRRGYAAPWLERKLTDDMRQEIEGQIIISRQAD